jgi:hypothetical protein
MKTVRTALVLAMIGVVLSLWLLVEVKWYNFMVFMLVAQPLLLAAMLMFLVALVREARRQTATHAEGPRRPA